MTILYHYLIDTLKYISGDGLNWESASFSLEIKGKISKEMGILELIPQLASLAKVPGLKQVNNMVKIYFEIRPGIFIELSFLDKEDDSVDKLVFDKFLGELSYGATLGFYINLYIVKVGVLGSADIFLIVEAPHGSDSFGIKSFGISLSGRVRVTTFFYTWTIQIGPFVFGYNPKTMESEFFKDRPEIYGIESVRTDCIRTEFLKYGTYSKFVGNDRIKEALNSKEQKTNQIEIIENVYENSEPVMTEKDGTSIIAWIHAVPPETKNQNDELRNTNVYFTEYNGNSFTTPAPIFEDDKAEFNPQVAYDTNGNVVAVWERFKDTDFDSSNIEDMASKNEIVYSVYSKQTKTWTKPSALTDNDYLDHLPKLKRNINGNLFLLWESNADNELIPTEAEPGLLHYSVWNGSSWADVKSVPYEFKKAFEYDVNCYQDTATIFWTQDQDGDQDTLNDQEIYCCKFNGSTWDSPSRITNNELPDSNPQSLIDEKGKLELFWLHDGKLVRLTDIMTGSFEIVREECGQAGFMEFNLTNDTEGNLVVFWQAQNDKGSEIRYMVYDEEHKSWGKDKSLTYGNEEEVVKYFRPFFNSSGQIMMAYNKEAVDHEDVEYEIDGQKVTLNEAVPGRDDLYLLTYELTDDLTFSVEGLILSDENASPGDEITIKATVENTGDSGLDDVEVAFNDGDPEGGGVLIESKTIPITLNAGSTYDVSVSWTLPDDNITHSIFAVIDPDKKIDEKNENNNTISNSILLPDLEIAKLKSEWEDEENIDLIAEVKNYGKGIANDIKVEFRKESKTGDVIGSVNIPTLNPEGSEEVTLSWNINWDQEFDADKGRVYVWVDPQDSVKELEEFGDDGYIDIEAPGIAEIPEVHIYSNKTTFVDEDTIEIGIFVYNPTNENIDMYSAIPLGIYLFWYPIWDTTPHPTVIEPGTWEQKIVQIPASPIPSGSYTFYVAIAEHETVNVLGLDYVTIKVE